MTHTPPTPLYRAGLVLVTVATVILAGLYVALTAAAAYGVYDFAVHDFLAVWRWPLGYTKVALAAKILCSCTPLLAGGAVALFMIKPLFARRGRRMQPLALDPTVEPRVYEVVRQVCGEMRAPAPHRVELSCDLNASARFDGLRRGFFGHRLILTLGMPLVAGLTQRELAGVLAHELGHFRQGGGMRLTYLIRQVNGWFARVVYDRDEWDEALTAATAQHEGGWMAIMLGCARIGIWCSRGVLWLLMMTGHAIGCLLLRQMEHDADRAEVEVAGTAAFESTTYKLAALGAVMKEIDREMRRLWRRQFQLPDNLPVLVEYRSQHLAPAQREKVENAVGFAKTGLLDTHPSPADRVRRARRLGLPGLVWSDRPARELFEHFETVSRLVTLAYYEDDLNVPTTPEFLVPLESVIRAKSASSNPPAAVPEPMPMMSYDPSAFQNKKPPGA